MSCTVNQSLQPLSSANMELLPEDAVSVLDWVQIETPDGVTEYYRVQNVSTDTVTGNQTAYMEQGACTLGDVLITADLQTKDTVSNLMSAVLAYQSRWTLGTVQATDTIYVDIGDYSVMDGLTTIMQSIPDYQLVFAQDSPTNWHVDVLLRPTDAVCEGRLSRNLKTCDVSYNASSICTRVYADGLTGGKMDSANIATYGIYEESQTLGDGLTAAQKEAIVAAYLRNHDHPSISISISALELSQVTGLTIDRFLVGTVCRIAIPWLNITADEVIVTKSYSDLYGNPENVSISLANATPDLALTVAAIAKSGAGTAKTVKKGNQRFNTKFEQTDRYIHLIATDTEYDEMEQGHVTAYSQITVNANAIQLETTRALGAEGNLSGRIDVQAGKIALLVESPDGSPAYIKLDAIVNDLNTSTRWSQVHIKADKILVEGNTTFTSDVDVQAALTGVRADFNSLVTGQLTASTIYANNLQAIVSGASGSGSVTGNLIYATNQLSVGSSANGGTGNLYFQGQQATWQTVTYVSSASVTMPSISRSNSRQFVYAVNGDTTNLNTVAGNIITSYTAGSSSFGTSTVYVLGRTS